MHHTPPLSATLVAIASESATSAMIPSPSRNHWIAAPAVTALPSRQYVRVPSSPQRTRGKQPFGESRIDGPTFKSIMAAVP
jgi:hypothetical protein